MFETLEAPALESSEAWNNAGTGHAANCELNYTPQRADGSVDISRALEVNVEFDLSRQFWSFLVKQGIDHGSPIVHPLGPAHELRDRGRECLVPQKEVRGHVGPSLLPRHGIRRGQEADRRVGAAGDGGANDDEPVAATRIVTGTDVDYGALTNHLIDHLERCLDLRFIIGSRVTGIDREHGRPLAGRGGGCEHRRSECGDDQIRFHRGGRRRAAVASEVRHSRGQGIRRLSVSGIWLRCDDPGVNKRHHAKVYGKAAVGSPPMSVPHLDTRVIGGKHSLLFGPYAGFSTRFLKHGSLLDLSESVRPSNIEPLLSVARDDFGLTEYLIGQLLQSENHRLAALDEYYPNAKSDDWRLQVAGQRVQIIKPDIKRGGLLEFGTELIAAEDRSLVALLGASPGASTAAFIAISVLKKCFPQELVDTAWLPKLREIIPSYGVSLIEDADFTRRVRADTAAVLNIENI